MIWRAKLWLTGTSPAFLRACRKLEGRRAGIIFNIANERITDRTFDNRSHIIVYKDTGRECIKLWEGDV